MLNMLTDRACSAKPVHKINPKTGKPRTVEKRYDGGGLFLLIKVLKDDKGDDIVCRLWQFDYDCPGKVNATTGRKVRNTLGFGAYPEISLDDARLERDKARKLLREGKDPGQHKQQAMVVEVAAGRTFADEAKDFYESQMVSKDKRGSTLRRYRFYSDQLIAKFGPRPLGAITVDEVKTYLQAHIDGGNLDKALRLRNCMRRIFERAVKQQRAKINPAVALDDEWTKPVSVPLAFISDPVLIGKMLREVRGYKGNVLAAKAVEMMALTFPRPHNINAMQWAHIDVETATWTIPESGIGGMKMGREHLVPLSRQALHILECLRPLTGGGKYVFSVTDKPLTSDAMQRAIQKTSGITTKEHTVHGFRKTAATLLHEEARWYSAAIQLQLAHVREKGETKVHSIYNKAQYWDIRILMMQAWADRLDAMRDGTDGANVVPLVKAA